MVSAMYLTVCVASLNIDGDCDVDFRALNLLYSIYDFGTMGKHPVKPRGSMYLIY